MKKYLFFLLAICILQFMALNVSALNSVGNGCGDVTASSTATDGSSNVYVTGAFCSSYLKFLTTTLTNQSSGNAGRHDMFIVKYSSDGSVLWAISAGGVNSDYGSSIATDGSGNVYVTGAFYSPSITFFGTNNITKILTNAASGNSDMFIVKYSSTGIVQWAKSAGGNSNEAGIGVATYGSGNVYVTGSFESSSLTFSETTTLTNAGTSGNDMFIVKYDADGVVKWAKSAGGSGDDYGSSIAAGGSGVYVTGWFNSSSITISTPLLSTTLYTAGNYDMFIVKYDADGYPQWAKSAGGSNIDHGDGIVTDGSGVYVTGSFASSSITFGTTILTNAKSGYYDIFIVKYDANGNVPWAKSAAGSSRDEGRGIATDASGNVFVTGGFASTSITFGNNITLTNSHKSIDIYIVKYDAEEGDAEWAKSAGGTNVDWGEGIATDGSGNAFIVGYFNSSSITFGTIPLSNKSVYANMFIAKYEANGTVPWAKSVAGTCVLGKPKSTNAGINDELTNEITIYPNPTTGKVILSTIDSQSAISSISVFNIMGKEVLSQQPAAGRQQIDVDLSAQPKGLYILRIKAGENFYSRKIILQ